MRRDWVGLSIVLFVSTMTIFHGNVRAQSETATPFKHVVIIMQENHSFDNYFGTYPTANGTIVGGVVSQLEPVNGIPAHVCLPLGSSCISPMRANGTSTVEPIEGQTNYQAEYSNGLTTGFPSYSGPQSMIYFDYHQIPAYWDYAEEYGLADNYFSSALSTTTPNRLMLFAGDSPVSFNYGPPPYIPYDRTILGQLHANGITWGYFDYLRQSSGNQTTYPLNYISGLDANSRDSIQNASHFFEFLSRGTGLPAVSFVMSLSSNRLDEHPPRNVTAGEAWVVSVVNAVMKSDYWNSTLMFITWDEGGGYYDHVVPPHILTIGLGLRSVLDGYGQRVPLLVISPFSKENYVSKTLLNHLSLVRFVEYNWNLSPLTKYVADSNNLLDFFDFGASRNPLILNSTDPFSSMMMTYPIPLQISLSKLSYARSGSWSGAAEQFGYQAPLVPAIAITLALAIAVLVVVRVSRNRRRAKLALAPCR